MKYIKTYEEDKISFTEEEKTIYNELIVNVYKFINNLSLYYVNHSYDYKFSIDTKYDKLEIYDNKEQYTFVIKFLPLHEGIIRMTYDDRKFILFQFLDKILDKYTAKSFNGLRGGFYFKGDEIYDAIDILNSTTREDFDIFRDENKYNL